MRLNTKLSRITFLLLILFLLNVIVACGKDSNKRAVKVSGAKSGAASGLTSGDQNGKSDEQNTSSDKRENPSQTQATTEKDCGIKLNDDMSASSECVREREAQRIIDGTPFQPKQIKLTTRKINDTENSTTFEIVVSMIDRKTEVSDMCDSNSENGSRVLDARIKVDLSIDGKPSSIKNLKKASDEAALGLILVNEDSNLDVNIVVQNKMRRKFDLIGHDIFRKINLGLKEINFDIVDGELVINQDKVDFELDLVNEEKQIDFAIKSSAQVCESKL